MSCRPNILSPKICRSKVLLGKRLSVQCLPVQCLSAKCLLVLQSNVLLFFFPSVKSAYLFVYKFSRYLTKLVLEKFNFSLGRAVFRVLQSKCQNCLTCREMQILLCGFTNLSGSSKKKDRMCGTIIYSIIWHKIYVWVTFCLQSSSSINFCVFHVVVQESEK